METVDIIAAYYVILFSIYSILVVRLYLNVSPIVCEYYFNERVEWNENLNPEKLKILLILFLVASLMIWFTYQPFVHPKSLLDICLIFFLGTISLAGASFFINDKIQTPTMRYLKTHNELSSDKNYSEITNKKSIITMSKLSFEELKNKFESGMQNKWFSCEFSQIEQFAYLNEPKSKISWLVRKNKNNTFNVDSILDFIESFSFGNFSVLTNGEIAALSNKYFNYLDSQNSNTFEMKPDNVQKWKTRTLKRSKETNL
ncbi:hypothetical protein [Flavobacterium sp. 14A]|uniref:hypothetical protein n=1 Tax=Flavobacterium sp. 14A TaxID=2735896 RepID=UPI00156FF389|nr:hypothetical protein [Flavobacterium sp. 14A]NRT11273.1 ABC-type multidrug transport system fused ATPase/permease subunit [Flavobacterium sp. 14A]